MSLDVKICGLSTAPALEAAVAAGATHAGFIFFERSPRHVTPAIARDLAETARARGVRPVAVTVDADDATIDEIVAVMRPDMLQLHGAEPPARLAALKARHGLQIIKAFAISAAADLDKLAPYRGMADRFLLDAKPPKGSDLPGGNGVCFDWQVLAALDADTDYFLSGGLDPANIARAIAIADPPGVDISSGVERAPGIKDPALIAQLFEAIAGHQGARRPAAQGEHA
ncbi:MULTISPECIES: phosphoribosylanthranilate isomerase [unclassified Roseitalea]|uniref:phosphoribosylanthranilate isomerase n=1 Tax=unclassified Roseitalea TaxID=2639107 RepID=UPI00273F288B|nr:MULTISPECIES: phosphoribosylanthranilate isomerase [unclassified Roseitalea]